MVGNFYKYRGSRRTSDLYKLSRGARVDEVGIGIDFAQTVGDYLCGAPALNACRIVVDIGTAQLTLKGRGSGVGVERDI